MSNLASVQVVPRAPRPLTLDGTYGAIVNQDFTLPMPTGTFGAYQTHPAHEGDALLSMRTAWALRLRR